MGRWVAEGRSVKVTVPVPGAGTTTINQGDFAEYDGFLGLATQKVEVAAGAASGKELILRVEPAEYETKQINTADTFAKGAKVYWDTTNKRFTTTGTGNRFAGVVTSAKDTNNVIWFWFIGHIPAAGQAANVATLIDNSGGTVDGTVQAVPSDTLANAAAAANNNFAELAAKFNSLINALRNAGKMA